MRRLSLTLLVLALACGVASLAFGSDRAVPAAVAEPAADALADSFVLEAQGDLAGALRATREEAEQRPKRYFPRVRVAYLELQLKSYSAAVDDYGRAAALAPRSIEALLGKQQALLALARFGEAETVGREVLTRDADNYLASSRLAWTLFSLKRYDEAAKVYARVLTLYPGDLEMMTGLGYSELRGGRKREAAEAFRAVLAIVPSHARAREGLAGCR